MEDKNLTPEERLLKIIETSGNQTSGSKRPAAAAAGEKKSVPAGPGVFLRLPAGGGALRTVIQLSAAAAVSATLFLLYDYAASSSDYSQRFKRLLSSGGDSVAKTAAVKAPDLKDLLESAGKHNIFAVEPDKAENLLSAEAAQTVSTLKLVGILWSERPQAMVEDTKNSKTYLLNNGDSLNDLKVKQIYVDKVVLSKDGKDWELR